MKYVHIILCFLLILIILIYKNPLDEEEGLRQKKAL
jgi:hypothetical protein